jgi:hypothetical protein
MTFRNAATVALVLALVSIGIYWYVSRPTVEEKALIEFFREFRLGHYDEAQEMTVNDDFYEMAASTTVRDTDGSEYLIGDYFSGSRRFILEASIRSYVRQHIARWRYLSLETQRVEDNYAVVHFRIDIAVRDFTTGGLLAPEVHNGRVEGTAHMVLENGNWVVRNFDLNIFSDEGLVLANYLERAG